MAVYLRKSKIKNGESVEETLQSHMDRLIEFCEKNNLTYTLYNDFVAKSTDLDREEYRKMLKACIDGEHKIILCVEESRLYRTVHEQTNVYEDLKGTGVVIFSLREGLINPSDRNQFLSNIIRGAMNQQELESFAYRMNIKKLQTAKSKYVNKIPFGYLKNKDKLIPHPIESNAFRLIVEKLLDGWTFKEIIIELNKRGFTTKQGKKFKAPSTISRWLDNRVYLGESIYNSKMFNEVIITKNTHEPLMSTEEFYKIKEIIATRSRNKQGIRYTKINTPLDRLMYCGLCGHRLPIFKSWTNQQGKTSWQISNCKNMHGENFEHRCQNKSVSLNEFLPYFYDGLGIKKEELKKELQSTSFNSSNDKKLKLLEEIKRLEGLMKEKKEEKDNAAYFLIKRTLSETKYLELTSEIDEELKELEKFLEDTNNMLAHTNEDDRKETIKNTLSILENIEDEDVETQNRIFRKIFDKVELIHTEKDYFFKIYEK